MKIDIQYIEEVLSKYGYVRNKLVSYPSWVNYERKEGFEIVLNDLRSFGIKNGEKDYTAKDSTIVTKIKEELHINEQKPEPEQNKNKNPDDGKFVNHLPEVYDGKRIIVSQDLDELKKMTVFERILLFQKTHPSVIKTKTGRGGKPQKYVEGNIMKLEANIAFLFDVSSKIDGWHIEDDSVACYGTMKFNIDGKIVIKSGVGVDIQEYTKESKKPVFTQAELMKNAHTDMQKKILSDLGFNGDVYRGEV